MLKLDIRKTLGDFRLDVSFTAGAGVTALFGPSGSGKTSVAQMVAGLLKPERGRIEVGGKVLFDGAAGINLPPEKRGLGYVFQEGRLFPHLTVRSNLVFGQKDAPKMERRGVFDDVISMLGIDGLLYRYPKTLSGGEKQRVAIGRALLANPKILIMDEPLAALDEARKAEVLPYLIKLVRHSHCPILYVSHSMNEVLALADTLVLLEQGKLIAAGTVETLLSRPDLRPLTGRLDAGAVINATVADHDDANAATILAFQGGQVVIGQTNLSVGEPVRLRIQAKDIAIALDPPKRTSVRNIFQAVIKDVKPAQANLVDITLDVHGTPLWAQVSRQSLGELGLVPGLTVWAMIKAVTLGRDMTVDGLGRPPYQSPSKNFN